MYYVEKSPFTFKKTLDLDTYLNSFTYSVPHSDVMKMSKEEYKALLYEVIQSNDYRIKSTLPGFRKPHGAKKVRAASYNKNKNKAQYLNAKT